MSQYCAKVCSIIIGETFGTVLQTIADVLLFHGPSPLTVIVTETKYPPSVVQDSLKTLLQHFVVECELRHRALRSEFIYSVRHGQTIELTRYPKYFAHVESKIGTVSREILEEVVKCGLVSISKLIYICGFRVLDSNPDVTESILYEQLVLFQNTILRLASRKYICVVESKTLEPSDEDSQSQPRTQNLVPNVDLKLILSKLRHAKKNVNLDELSDADLLWRINLSQFHAEIRNVLVYEALERKFKSMVDPRVLEIIIDLGFDKHPWENDGNPISIAELRDSIEKHPGGKLTSGYMHEHIEIIEDDPRKLISKLSNTHGGHFSFNMKGAVAELLWGTVDRIITARHGFHALRIFRLVKQSGFVEQDAINEMGMIPGKDAKHLTYKLVEDNFLIIKEVRKSYAASAPPGKVCHVFFIDINHVVKHLQEFCYKAIINLKQKTKIEMEKIKRLSMKEERITRILVNMTVKKCSEDQLNEIRDLLTPPERGLLRRYQMQSQRLFSGAMHVDETLFVTELYMLYNQKIKSEKNKN